MRKVIMYEKVDLTPLELFPSADAFEPKPCSLVPCPR